MDIIGIIGIVISLSIAYWQYRKAKLSTEKLQSYLHELPLILVRNVTRLLNKNENNLLKESGEDIITSSNNVLVNFADIDNDGTEELLVQFPYGAYGSALQVYGIKNFRFHLISEISSCEYGGFKVEDIDLDGNLELKVIETNKSSGLPYVGGLRDKVWYRLEGNEFIEVKREEPSPSEINQRIKVINEIK
jgi:hypothetical protein